ncbi:MAG: hypothetical protein RLZZ155_1245 [Bacteroidota bacterium]
MFEIENKSILELAKLSNGFSDERILLQVLRDSNFNWKYFADRSLDTILSSVILTRLKSSKELLNLIPDEISTQFFQIQAQVVVKNTFLKSRFDEIIEDFNILKFDVIPLKGIYLIDAFYKNFTHRQVSDIDLLVRESQVEEVCHYFLRNGFEMEMYMPAKAAKVSKTPAPYKFSKNGLVIDLHVGLTYIYDNCQFKMDEVWSGAKKIDRDYFEMNALDHFVYLFAHLIKHFDYRNCKLINFYDLCLVFEKDNIVFSELLGHSELLGCESDVKDICYLLKKYFGVDFFADLLLNYKPRRKNIDEIFLEILSIDRVKLEVKYAPQGSTGFLPMKHLSFKNKFIYILSRIFPDGQYIQCKYGRQKRSMLVGYISHFNSIRSQIFRAMKFKAKDSATPPSK